MNELKDSSGESSIHSPERSNATAKKNCTWHILGDPDGDPLIPLNPFELIVVFYM